MIAAAAGGATAGVSAGLDHAIAAIWADVGGVPKNNGGDVLPWEPWGKTWEKP